jgi:hypothetical protein
VQDIAGVEQSFGWHAPAQNAEATHLISTFDNGCAESRRGRRSRRGIASAPAAQHSDIEVKMSLAPAHFLTMRLSSASFNDALSYFFMS